MKCLQSFFHQLYVLSNPIGRCLHHYIRLLSLDTIAPSPSNNVTLVHLSKEIKVEETLDVDQVSMIPQKELSRQVDLVIKLDLRNQ